MNMMIKTAALALSALLCAAPPALARAETVMVFSPAAAPPPTCGPMGRTYVVRIEPSPRPNLPPTLTVCTGAAPKGVTPADVVGAYAPHGPKVLAKDIAGSSPAPVVAGKTARTYSLVVLSNPTAGQEEAYNDWYDHQHVQDVLRNPGFQSAQRYKLIANKTPGAFPLPAYAIQFFITSSDLEATTQEVVRRLKAGITKASPAFDMATSVNRYYEPAH
jgi:hypothetical protein